MKHQNLKILLTLLISMMGIETFAHDIAVANVDGMIIYYTFYTAINGNKELSVSYMGSSYSSYSNEYTGNVVIPESVSYNGTTYPVTSIGASAFRGCSGLTSIEIPNSVTSIGVSAFRECSGLTSIEIPNSVTSIGNFTFRGCSGLTSVTIGNSVTSIGDYAFYGCSGLTSLTIPNSVTSIGGSAFNGCNGLTSITIGNSVTSIGNYAFEGCTGLKVVHISDLVAWCNISFSEYDANPLACAHHLFLNEDEITELIIPNSVTTIGDYAFEGCTGLTSVTIPNSVTSIGSSAFQGCSSLTSIDIPPTVTIIEENTFSGCEGLTSVSLSDKLEIIKVNAFDGCSKLKSIIIPASVNFIYPNAFKGCSSLQTITAQPTTPPFLADNAFPNFSVPVSVPSGCKTAYQEAQGWMKFTTINDGNMYYNLIVKADGQGKATYGIIDVTNGQQTFDVKEGSDAVLTLTPNEGFQVSQIIVNGEDRTADVVDGELTLGNLTANTTVSVSFGVAGEYATVTIGSAKMATFCPAEDVDFTNVEGVKAYIGSIFNRQTGTLTLTRAYDVPAGTGLLIKGEPGRYEIPYSQSFSIASNLLKGVITTTDISTTEDGNVNYVLGSGSQGVGFYKVGASGISLEAGRAYLQIPAEVSLSRVNLRFDDEDEATGIDASLVKSEERIVNNAIFDLQGRKVEKPQRGLYIRDGKKVVVK